MCLGQVPATTVSSLQCRSSTFRKIGTLPVSATYRRRGREDVTWLDCLLLPTNQCVSIGPCAWSFRGWDSGHGFGCASLVVRCWRVFSSGSPEWPNRKCEPLSHRRGSSPHGRKH